MRRNELFKRAFVAAVCFSLGAAAYFQAAGIMSLVRAALLPSENEAFEPPVQGRGPQKPVHPGALDFKETSAAAILARNPFDSVTGPLVGHSKKIEDHSNMIETGEGPCEGVRVMLITESADPAWSFAAIAEGASRAILRRVGDEVAGMAIQSIDWNSVRMASGVKGCYVRLGEAVEARGGGITKALQTQPEGSARPPGRGGALAPELAAKIRQAGEHQVVVDRSLISDAMDRQGEVFGRLRILPVPDGVRVTGIAQGSLLALLGMENGDELRSVNGMMVSDPRSAMEAYMKLMKADHWVVNVSRRGKPLNLDVQVQ